MNEYEKIYWQLPAILQTEKVKSLLEDMSAYQQNSPIKPYKRQAFQEWLASQPEDLQKEIFQSILENTWDLLLP